VTAKPVFRAPKHLKLPTRRWVEQVVAEYVLEQHHLRVLLLAAQAWDQGQDAREALVQHGAVFTDRFGQPRSRPEVAHARDAMIVFARLVRELGLDVTEPGDSRPPGIQGQAARRGVR
jgi:phage terminase small subunit